MRGQKPGRGEAIWLTPPEFIRALGPFDLDPCFSEPRPWATAAQHYGPDAAGGLGGLFAPWHGLVWCNPPYGDKWAEWLARCAEHGSAIALIFARTETADFEEQVWRKASGILFIRGRVCFRRPDGAPSGAPAAPSVLIAYGEVAANRLRGAGLRGAGLRGQFIDLRAQRAA